MKRTIVLELTLDEAVQMAANIGAQTTVLSKKIFNSASPKYDGYSFDDEILYQAWSRLDDLVVKGLARNKKAKVKKDV